VRNKLHGMEYSPEPKPHRFWTVSDRIGSLAGLDITRGVWVREGSKVDFGINDTHSLIIASIEGLEHRYICALDGSYIGRRPKRIGLPDNGLIEVNVSLMAESQGNQLRKSAFMLQTKRETKIMVQAKIWEMWEWKQDQLLDFVREGIE
jgi:hypothetical protein